MSFLNPLFWLGALGALVPVLLHLRKRKDPRAVRFAAVLFLEDQSAPRSRSWRVRDPWLLLARLLALLLIVAGFTWPYRRSVVPLVKESRVYLLDNTFSRQVGDGFLSDRDEVLKAISGGGDFQRAVVELRGTPRVVVGFSDEDAEARQKLGSLKPSFERGSFLEAFRLAHSLLAQSLGERKKILLYSDNQENQWSENENSPPFLADVEVVFVRRPVRGEIPNLAVGETTSRLFFVGEKTFVDFEAQLSHHGGIPEAEVVVEANGHRILKQTVDLRREPDLVTIRAQWETDPAVWLRGEIRLEGAGDALPADDRSYFCLPPVREGRIALLAQSAYLKAALSPEITRGRWSTDRVDPARIPREGDPAELADVLVVEATYAQSEQVRDLLYRYLNNERGVVLLVNRATPLVIGFLKELGFELPAGNLGEKTNPPDGLRFVSITHPIFRPFSSGELRDLMSTRIFHHTPLRSKQAMPLIWAASGDALLFEGRSTKGRLLVFGFGMDRKDTDWVVQPSFIPFLDLLLQHARQATLAENTFHPAGVYAHPIPPHRDVREVALRREEQEIGRFPVVDHKASITLPDSPGHYLITYDGDRTVEGMLAINPPLKESRLKYVSEPAAIKAWQLPARTGPLPPAVSPPLLSTRSLEQRIWWWLLASAALTLLAETMILLRRVPS